MRGLTISRYVAAGVAASIAMAGPWDLRRAAADEPNADVAALTRAVLDGKDFRMVIDFSACQVHGTDKAGPPVKGSSRFDGVLVQSDGTIAFSTTHFTVRSDNLPVNEFLSYRVHPTGKIDARTIVMNPMTYSALRESEFDCEIGKGVTFHW